MPVQRAEVEHRPLLARAGPPGAVLRPDIAWRWPWQLSLGHDRDLGCC
jgi:hypothetical protein